MVIRSQVLERGEEGYGSDDDERESPSCSISTRLELWRQRLLRRLLKPRAMVPAIGVSRPLTAICFDAFLPKASKSDCARGARGRCFRSEANETVKTIDERLNLHQGSEIRPKWGFWHQHRRISHQPVLRTTLRRSFRWKRSCLRSCMPTPHALCVCCRISRI